jgi:predicted GIY-YIG superfamily endonuclease
LAGQQMQRFFYVYVLVSEADEAIHYTGTTQELQARLTKHNRGSCAHTSKHRPRRIQTAIAFDSEAKARAFEKYVKTGSGGEFARRHFGFPKAFGAAWQASGEFCRRIKVGSQFASERSQSLHSCGRPFGLA